MKKLNLMCTSVVRGLFLVFVFVNNLKITQNLKCLRDCMLQIHDGILIFELHEMVSKGIHLAHVRDTIPSHF